MDLKEVDRIVDKYQDEKGSSIAVLQDIQSSCNYLPRDALLRVSQRLGTPLSHLVRIATFYTAFSLEPRGRHLISVCMGTACHVRGGPRILERLERNLAIKSGETTDNFDFTLRTVHCLGACALAPLMVIDGKYFGKMNSNKVGSIMKRYQKQNEEDKKS